MKILMWWFSLKTRALLHKFWLKIGLILL